MGIVFGVVVVAVVLFAVGFATYPGPLGYSVQLNNNVEGCERACANLRSKRSQTCAMRSAVASSRAAMVAAGTLFAAALATSVAAAVAVGVASAIPIIGPVIASALAIIAAAALLYANYLMGRYAAAVAAYATMNKGLAEAVRLEGEALDLVNSSCSLDVATSCAASLPECAV